MLRDASLIIPNRNSEKELLALLRSFNDWIELPKEILIIDSSDKAINLSQEFKNFFDQQKIILKCICREQLYPGHARNLGIRLSTFSTICFLDVQTLPDKNWFANGFKSINNSNNDGIWGSTIYISNTFFEKVVRACTFGEKPIRTLPGSFIKKDVFAKTGLFIESTRAGEDADWMSRAQLHNFLFDHSKNPLMYNGLINISFTKLISKWYRNYIFSAKLPYLNPHKDIYFYVAAILMILVALNWNTLSYDYTLRGWNLNSLAYIPNITKISIAFVLSAYTAFRGIFLPLKKGINIWFIFKSLPMIIFLSIVLDLVKLCSFFVARIVRRHDLST